MYSENPRLLAILAHPDDETLGMGGTFAHYAAQGVDTYLITATRGQRGWFGKPEENPGLEKLGQIREGELATAAHELGIQEVNLLDYMDGDLDKADSETVVDQLVNHIRRIRPHVVVTFDPFGAYGHPDHIAICQHTTNAVIMAADENYYTGTRPHAVSKLYYIVDTLANMDIYQQAFGELVMNIDGVERRPVGWPQWSITTQIDISAYRKPHWEAILCHRSQLQEYEKLLNLPRSDYNTLMQYNQFYRAFSRVPVPAGVETDLFAGIDVEEYTA